VETVPWLPCIGGGIERVFFSPGKQHGAFKKRTMDKTLEITWKASINTTLPTCDDKEVFTMMMTHTGNTSSLQCQEVGRRKGAKVVVVIWTYSVALVWLV
jgi:hypothetical protein